MSADNRPIPGSILEESAMLTLADLSRMCAVEERHIVQFVEEGVLETIEVVHRPGEWTQWRFHGSALRRARLAVRLERDLEINLAGVALALELMEELEYLRRELRVRR